jgi:hypothetical protein
MLILFLLIPEPPRLPKTKTDEAEDSLEESDSTISPPPTNSEDKSLEKKRKRTEDLASSSTSIPTYASEGPAASKDSELQTFELLDS